MHIICKETAQFRANLQIVENKGQSLFFLAPLCSSSAYGYCIWRVKNNFFVKDYLDCTRGLTRNYWKLLQYPRICHKAWELRGWKYEPKRAVTEYTQYVQYRQMVGWLRKENMPLISAWQKHLWKPVGIWENVKDEKKNRVHTLWRSGGIVKEREQVRKE